MLKNHLMWVFLCLQAVREIQNLVKTSKCLDKEKKKLIDMQSAYLKKLSLLSGMNSLSCCVLNRINKMQLLTSGRTD